MQEEVCTLQSELLVAVRAGNAQKGGRTFRRLQLVAGREHARLEDALLTCRRRYQTDEDRWASPLASAAHAEMRVHPWCSTGRHLGSHRPCSRSCGCKCPVQAARCPRTCAADLGEWSRPCSTNLVAALSVGNNL